MLKIKIKDYIMELLTKDNYHEYLNVFYTNEEYYRMTDGRTATEADCLDTIEYCPNGFEPERVRCVGFKKNGVSLGVLSYLEGYPSADILYIGLLLIHQDFQGENIGGRVVRAVIQAAKSASYGAVQLSVECANSSALRFWKKHGFIITSGESTTLSMELRIVNDTERTEYDGIY